LGLRGGNYESVSEVETNKYSVVVDHYFDDFSPDNISKLSKLTGASEEHDLTERGLFVK
jgi:hypothetical protein